MPQALDRQAVRKWLSGQQAAGRVIKKERLRFLVSLTAERSLEIYLALAEAGPRELSVRPSPLLLAMRRALSRMEQRERP